MVAQVCEREVGSLSLEPTPTPGNSSVASPSSPVTSDSLWTPTDAIKLEIAVSLSFLVGVIQVINNVVPVFPWRMLSCYLRTPSTPDYFLVPLFLYCEREACAGQNERRLWLRSSLRCLFLKYMCVFLSSILLLRLYPSRSLFSFVEIGQRRRS